MIGFEFICSVCPHKKIHLGISKRTELGSLQRGILIISNRNVKLFFCLCVGAIGKDIGKRIIQADYVAPNNGVPIDNWIDSGASAK